MEEVMGLVMTVVIGVGAFIAWQQRAEALERARLAYTHELEALRTEPSSSTRYASALEAGRAYARLCREQRKVAIFDELALQNDLMAATVAANRVPAATRAPASAPASQASPAMGVEQRLLELKTLRDKGLLDESTYEQKRAAILASL